MFFPIFMPEGGFIAQQVGDIAGLSDVVLIGADGLLVNNFMELAETEGMYFSGPNLSYGANQSETGVDATGFLAAYEAAYGESRRRHSGHTAMTRPSCCSQQSTMLLWFSLMAACSSIARSSGMTERDLRVLWNHRTLGCDAFGDCGAQRISIVRHLDSSDIQAGKDNIVFEFSAF